jgi:protein-S-isoprenylcysteine O-methyltransferase Ste14
MALVHEFEKTGNWLFRYRSWLPVLMVVSGILVMNLVNRQAILHDLNKELICLAVSMFGQTIRISIVGFTPKNTSARNTGQGQVADEINMTGLYSVIRHPLYLGNFFMWLGPVLFISSVWFTIVFFLVYWLYYERIMFAEEQYMRKKFGELYDRWSENVSAVIPGKLRFVKPNLPFSVKNVLKREHNGIANIFAIFILLDLFRNYFLSGRIHATELWAYAMAGALSFWIIIRILHKMTTWLQVEGR